MTREAVCEVLLDGCASRRARAPHTLGDFAGVRLRRVNLFLLFERNGQNQQQADQTERGERDESEHQDGHSSLLPCIVRQRELGFGDGGHWAL